MATDQAEGNKQELTVLLSLASELGLLIALPLVGGAILGLYLDNRLNTSPRLTLSFLFIGLIVGGYGTYKRVSEWI